MRHSATLKALASWGLPVEPHWATCQGIEAVAAFCEEWAEKRRALAFDTDGVVIKVDDIALRQRLGATANAAFRRSIFFDPAIGLLDEALGAGMPTGCSEDRRRPPVPRSHRR